MEIREEAKLGSGARFKALKKDIASKGSARDPGAVAASIGREKYGKAKFQKLAAAGHHESLVPALGAAEAAELSEADEKCPHCGSDETFEAAGGGHRCRRCKKSFKKGGSGDPLMDEALAIVDALIEPEQHDLPMPYSGDPTTLSHSLNAPQHPGEGGPWGRIVQRAREKRQAEEERMAAEREQAKYRTAMTRPKGYGMMTRPKADVMPGGGSMQIGDTTAIGSAGGGY